VSIESHADLEGLRRVGRVVALTLTAHAAHTVVVTRSESPLVLTSPR
jgi:hypothetical protein